LAVLIEPEIEQTNHRSLSFETDAPQMIHSKSLIHSYFP
jgi:hypothetical protein